MILLIKFAMNITIEADREVESSMRILRMKCGEAAINLDVGGDETLKTLTFKVRGQEPQL